MPRRPTRPFTVEVRSSRKSLLHPAVVIAGLGDKSLPADDLPNGKPHTSTLDGLNIPSLLRQDLARPEIARIRAPAPKTSAPESQPEAQTATKPLTDRILPDLQAEDPMEALLRREVEQRALRPPGRPRGSRSKPKLQATQAALRLDEEQIARRRAVLRQTAPAEEDLAEATNKPVLVETVSPEPVSTPPAETRILSRAVTRAFSPRAKRRGVPASLPAGQRWKRRLPKALW